MEREVCRYLDGLPCDLFVILIVKGKHSTEEKIADDSQRPVVNLLAIWLLKENFWGYIGKGTKWLHACLVWPNNLGQPKVNDLERRCVRLISHQDVLWLQISVSHPIRV